MHPSPQRFQNKPCFAIHTSRTLIREAGTLSSATTATLRPSFPNNAVPTYQSHNQTRRRRYHNGAIASNNSPHSKNVLILGSHGILGQTLVSQFQNNEYNVFTADVHSSDHPLSLEQRRYVDLPRHGSIADVSLLLYRGVARHLKEGGGSGKLDAIVVASGGWEGDVEYDDVASNGNNSEAEDEEYIKAAAGVVDNMMRMNYYPVVAGSLVGQRFMNPNGLFVIIGASAALSPTPGMIGYGSSKAAAHHHLQSFGTEGNTITSVGILPLMLDTPNNRAMMKETDERYTKMVKPIHIANEINEWIKTPVLRPHSGSLVKVIAKERRDETGGANFHLVR